MKTKKTLRSAELEKLGLSLNSILAVLAVGTTCFLIGMEYQKSKTVDVAKETSQSTTIIPEPTETTTTSTAVSSASAAADSSGSSADTTTGLININTATSAELDTLPGIGPTYAQAIINYRTVNGPFKTAKDIVNVKGIGEKTYEKLKDKITI